METIDIVMVGPRGVGKTSLLASMYKNLEAEFDETSCQFRCGDGRTRTDMDDHLTELKALCRGLQPKTAGVGPSADVRKHVFTLAERQQPPSLELRFIDIPGGHYASKTASEEDMKNARNFLSASKAAVVAIHTPALMESGGKKTYHDRVNKPGVMYELFKDAFEVRKEPLLVILSPIRYETYRDIPGKVAAAVREGYKDLLKLLNRPEMRELVAVVLAPVETVGCLKLKSVTEDENGEPLFKFAKEAFGRDYTPTHCGQPLRYILNFTLGLHHAQTRLRGGPNPPLWMELLPDSWKGPLSDFFETNRHLAEAVHKISGKLVKGDGFEVIQGEKLLKELRPTYAN
jgi:hypothetical protein